jgi:hypothetical protein
VRLRHWAPIGHPAARPRGGSASKAANFALFAGSLLVTRTADLSRAAQKVMGSILRASPGVGIKGLHMRPFAAFDQHTAHGRR